MTTAIVHIPSPVLAPRGAALAANVMASVLAWLEAVGTARAAAHARRDQATRIAEAAATRRYAQQWIERDPRFKKENQARLARNR